jgi:cytosine/adenosine deaminase-related metal-dependent hydrolase
LVGAVLVRPEGPTQRSLHIAGGRVVAAPCSSAHEIDLSGHFLFPGLVNAHDHLHVNAVPPLPGGPTFPNAYAWAAAFGPHFRDAAVAEALAVPLAVRHWHGGLKNLLAGATTVAHHDPWAPVLETDDFPVRVLRRFGWCHSLGQAPRPGVAGRIARLLARVTRRQPAPFGPPVRESFVATARDVPWIIHLAEGTDAVARDELRQLDQLGCLASNTVLVHAVGLGAAGVARVIDRGAAVVWCPASNLALLGETLDPRLLFDAGRLALGTDSRLSGSRDLLDELRVASARGDLSPAELVRLATVQGGRVLGLPDAGGLEDGQCADLVIVRDPNDTADPCQHLVGLRRADLRAVVRRGRPAIADPDFAGWFTAAGIEATRVTLDGRPKLLARRFARPEAMAREPGLIQDAG